MSQVNNDAFVEFSEVSKSHDGHILSVQDFSLSVAQGEFVTLLGPSGCGKTTCLKMIAGFEDPTTGLIAYHMQTSLNWGLAGIREEISPSIEGITMKVGFIGLGNAGAKLAGSLLRHGFELWVRDLDRDAAQPLLAAGARWGESPATMMRTADVVITCLPTPAASAAVLEADDGLLSALSEGKIWMEMSTTDEAEVRRLGERVLALGGEPVDCPVSGGCHRAATGNISIFAGCERSTFERILPLLTTMGRRILHTGPLGSASILKVVTNYLATANLVSCCEALVTAKAAGLNLNTTREAIRISSGNSFVHETESQVILNGSRDISFTMDLVRKDIGLFQAIADRHDVPLELNPVMVEVFKDGEARYGPREWSPNIIRRLEDATGLSILAPGFPEQIVDDEPEAPGLEVVPKGRS